MMLAVPVPVRAIAFATALLTTGCGADVFACDEDSDCADAGAQGACEVNGYCSFPDDACASERRYGNKAPAGIAGTCVPVGEGTGDGSGSSSTTATMSTSSSTSASTTQGVDESSSSSSSSSSTSEDPATSGSSSSSSSSGGAFTVEYEATLAVCTEPGVFDPAHCALEAGVDQFTIDASDVDGNVSNGWLRFELDDQIEGVDIAGAELVLHVGNEELDDSDQTGEVWLVEPFDATTLTMYDPGALEILAEDMGAVAVDTIVVFELPSAVITPTSVLYLGLFATTDDGLDYYSHTAIDPPRLVILAK
jgi:hypothetical protein